MDDYISRQAAIEHIEAEYQAWGDEYDVLQILGDLEDLPSAQPTCTTCIHNGKSWDEEPCDSCTGTESKYEPDNGWIPVGERLPEEGQMCLVCDKGAIGIDTYIGHGNPYNWNWYVRDYDAWMPLPDPYKEEE